jgi:hypothetical protein
MIATKHKSEDVNLVAETQLKINSKNKKNISPGGPSSKIAFSNVNAERIRKRLLFVVGAEKEK